MGWGKARFFLAIAVLALFLAGAQNAYFDASRDRVFAANTILADYPGDRILESESANWRYKGRAVSNGPAFPGASTYAVAVTDFSHWSRFWQMTFLSLGALCLFWCGYYWPINLRWFGRLSLGVFMLAIGHLAYFGGLYTLWEVALPAGPTSIPQTVARVWVDGFIMLHDTLQARGILG